MVAQKVADDQIIAVMAQGLSASEMAREFGVNERNLRRRVSALREKHPEMMRQAVMGEALSIPGVERASINFGEDGEVRQQWLKGKADAQKQADTMRAAAEEMKAQIKPLPPIKKPKGGIADLLNLHVLTDYHMGMLSWSDETGEDWDIDIAESLLIRWFQYAVERAPDAQVGVLAQLGDFLHYDSMEAVTPTSKHILDSDSRYQKVVRAAIRSLRAIIEMMLRKYPQVHVIVSDANHDPVGGTWLREMLSVLYERNKRITVDTSPDTYNVMEHGDTSLFFHHGHKRGIKNISEVFTAKFREVFGRTKHSYAHMGHLHHTDVKEDPLMTVEQHRTMAAADAYASRGGYISGRSAPVITYSRKHGEVGRMVVTPDMVS